MAANEEQSINKLGLKRNKTTKNSEALVKASILLVPAPIQK